MRSMICPLCGCGKLFESFITGYECENCGETFNTDDSGEFTIIEYDEWKDRFIQYENNQLHYYRNGTGTDKLTEKKI